jgi:hypothetical protein
MLLGMTNAAVQRRLQAPMIRCLVKFADSFVKAPCPSVSDPRKRRWEGTLEAGVNYGIIQS